MARLTLVVGGVRSGKSRFAEALAAQHAPVTYLATARPGDEEMARRIAAHRARRPADWHTVEEGADVVGAVRVHAAGGCLLLECVPLWITNLLLEPPHAGPRGDEAILADVEALVEAGGAAPARVIVVSNEVGCGVLPANALARRFGDLLGEANQRLAAAAVEVYTCVAGIPLRIK